VKTIRAIGIGRALRVFVKLQRDLVATRDAGENSVFCNEAIPARLQRELPLDTERSCGGGVN